MKKILVCIFIITIFLLTGCVKGDQQETINNTEFKMLLNSGSCFVFTFKDSETGVWYISTADGVCPRYNIDGTLYTTK
jgi:hypothetical protein